MVDRFKTDGQLPEVCCGTCPFAFAKEGAPKDFPEIECRRHAPQAHPVAIAKTTLHVGNNGQQQGIGWIAGFTPMRKTLVCGDHPAFDKHPQMVEFNEANGIG